MTDEITREWSDMTTRQYKQLKGLKKENLCDNMSTLELVLNMLAEATTTELLRQQNQKTSKIIGREHDMEVELQQIKSAEGLCFRENQPATKEPLGPNDIISVYSSHVEAIVLMTSSGQNDK